MTQADLLEQDLLLAPDQLNSPLMRLQTRFRKITKENKLKIDIGKTEYPLLRTVATGELGWRVWTREQSKEEVNVYWVDTYVHEEMVRKLKPYQRVNHFPSSEHLGKKNLLTQCLNRMKRFLPQQFNFFPPTFNFPADIEDFEKFARSCPNSFYIIKPTSDSQGRGIYLTKQPETSSKEEVVVQEYITNPLLIDRFKFDLRLYVLLRSLSPLKIYLYEEGMSRLATSDYEKPDSSNQKDMRMHLTNYAINKTSPNFIFNKHQYEDHIGHKRSLSATLKILEGLGCNRAKLQASIDQIIVKTIMSAHQTLLKKYKELRDHTEELQSVCFEVLGFDILIQEDFTPILLEVNHSPSFAADTPLDNILKKNLLLDTLNLLNLNHEDKIHYLKSRNEQDNIHSNQILKTYAKHLTRDYEPLEIGAYRQLYPLDATDNDLSKIYERTLKASKKEKIVAAKGLAAPVPRGIPFSNQKIEKISSQDVEKKGHSLSYHSVIHNLKRTKLKQLKDAIELQQLLPLPLPNKKQTICSNPEDTLNPIQQEEVLLYQRIAKKDREKEKRKYILPMPVNSVNIRLDQKFTLRNKSTDAGSIQSAETQFKIHSMFNTSADRRKVREQLIKMKEEGNKTASNGFRGVPAEDDKFRATDRMNNFIGSHSYSIELKQKIQRMQMARLRLHKIKKVDKNSFMIIRSQSPEK